jgi:hypothetical protein
VLCMEVGVAEDSVWLSGLFGAGEVIKSGL